MISYVEAKLAIKKVYQFFERLNLFYNINN